MFKTEYIHELIIGQLSDDGYQDILGSISFFVRKYNWPKSIIVSNEVSTSKFWTAGEIKELTHQFFEWTISKSKFEYLNKIPESYLSYYFLQILISFVSNRIKEEQQKEGLSFEKCRELVLSICRDKYFIESIDGTDYVYNDAFKREHLKPLNEVDNELDYLSKIPLSELTKHYKPLVEMAVEDIFSTITAPISVKKMVETVYHLFDQSNYKKAHFQEESSLDEFEVTSSAKYKTAIKILLTSVSKVDAKLIFEYLFQSEGKISLSELASKYNLPKSTLHHKIEAFREKIIASYTPENEADGIQFIQHISDSLDEHSK